MVPVVGLTGDFDVEIATVLAGRNGNDELFALTRLDGTVGPTVDFDPSPALEQDVQHPLAVVLDGEFEVGRLALPDHARVHFLMFADEDGLRLPGGASSGMCSVLSGSQPSVRFT